MKTTTMFKLALIAFSFPVLAMPLQSQCFREFVPPDHQREVVSYIMDCYGSRIDIEEETILTFLAWEELEWYDETLGFPAATTISQPKGSIGFAWQAVPDVYLYQVKSINLATGEESIYWTEDTSIALPAEQPRSLYLYVFSTYAAGEVLRPKSADFIVIDEKPISKEGDEFPCACSFPLQNPLSRKKPMDQSTVALPRLQVYPNPTNGESHLEYELLADQEVAIWITDLLGRERKVLLAPSSEARGLHQFTFSLSDLPAGWYWCHLATEEGRQSVGIFKR